jgi:hypothetical protein
MRIDGIESHAVVGGDGGNQNLKPRDCQVDRFAQLGLMDFELDFDGEFHPQVTVAAEVLDPSG